MFYNASRKNGIFLVSVYDDQKCAFVCMPNKVLKLDSKDNVLIALADLRKGEHASNAIKDYRLEGGFFNLRG